MEHKKKRANEIKALIFDVGGVLALPRYPIKGRKGRIVSGVHSSIAKKLGISLDQYFDSIDTAYVKAIEGKRSGEKVVETTARNLKISKSKLKALYSHAYKTRFKQNKELFRFAFQFKEKGFKIAILSDQWPLSKKALITKELYKKFNPIIVSCDVGMRKPNPKIYRLASKKLKLPAKQIVFIDNREWNIKPAKKLGMKTVLFKNNKQAIEEIEKLLK